MRFQNKLLSRCVLALLATAGVLPRPAWSADCAIKSQMRLTDSQAGFVGTTGTIRTIGPDCNFTVARFVNDKISAPYLAGRLTPEQQASLAAALTAEGMALPARMGVPAPVNARQLSLEYDGKTSVLDLGVGGSDVASIKSAAASDPAKKLLDLSEAVKAVTGGD